MSIIGYIVSIPVFCDSGFVILNSLKKSLVQKSKVSGVMMSVSLATGLYATHTLVPPTPGPIAAAGNLGLEDQLGLVILVGLGVSIVTMLAGHMWAKVAGKNTPLQKITKHLKWIMMLFTKNTESFLVPLNLLLRF